MLVDLGKEALDNIVKDGVREMMSGIVGGTRGTKQRRWFIAVKEAIKEYQQKIQEDFLPVLINDFGKKMVVKFSGSKMSEEDKNKIKLFMEMVEKTNIKSVQEELMKKVEGLKVDGENLDLNEKLDHFKKVFVDGH